MWQKLMEIVTHAPPVFVPVSSSRSSSCRYTSFAPGHTSLVILLEKLLNLKYFELAASFTRSPRWNPFVCFSLPSNRVFAICHPPPGASPPAATKGRRWPGAAVRRAVPLQQRRAQQLPVSFPQLTSHWHFKYSISFCSTAEAISCQQDVGIGSDGHCCPRAFQPPAASPGAWWGRDRTRRLLGSLCCFLPSPAPWLPFLLYGCASQGCAFEPSCLWALGLWNIKGFRVRNLPDASRSFVLRCSLWPQEHPCCQMPPAPSLLVLGTKHAAVLQRRQPERCGCTRGVYTRGILGFCRGLRGTRGGSEARSCFFLVQKTEQTAARLLMATL